MIQARYTERLEEFADARTFRRLARVIRDRADALCDACGSALPRTLFALKEEESGRHFFVGENCLRWLAAEGKVRRAYDRESAQSAYQREMELRRSSDGGSGRWELSPGTSNIQRRNGPADADLNARHRTVLIRETDGLYETIVRLSDGKRSASGRATESRERLAWSRLADGVVVLESVSQIRRSALAVSVLRAYGAALARWRTVDADRADPGAG